MRMNAALVAMLLALVCVSAVAQQSTDFAGAHDQFTPVVMQATVRPVPFAGTDGMTHLDCELQLINTQKDAVGIEAIEVFDADTGKVLLKIAGNDLKNWFTLVDKTPATKLGPGQVGYAWLDVKVAGVAPKRLRHRVTVTAKERALKNSAMAPSSEPATFPIDGGEVAVLSQPVLVLGPPLQGTGWVAINGCCASQPHRRSMIPINGTLYVAQRFAIDWMKVGDDGRLVKRGGKLDVNHDYQAYGTNAIAVADATVVSVLDGLPERTAGALPQDTNLQNVTGNHVILDLGGRRYAFYAHLQPGTMRVKKGDRVKRGQVLALVGNSGNTTAPHLHFHVMDGLTALGAQGLPYVIDSFALQGVVRDIHEEEAAAVFTEPLPINPTPPRERRMQYPLENTVVDFPGGK